MATITVTASSPSASVAAQLYSKQAWREAKVNMAWKNFMGKGPNNPIVVVEDFTKMNGDVLNYTLWPDNTGKGIAKGATLETAEESVTPVVDTVLLDQLSFGMRLKSKLDEQRAGIEMRQQIRDSIGYQWARQLDELFFKLLSGVSYTDDNAATVCQAAAANTSVLYANSKTSSASLTDGDTFHWGLVKNAVALAKVGKTPAGLASWRIKPMYINGKPYYGCWLHPWQVLDLKKDPNWAQAQREAELRGKDNPIFSGAIGVEDGVIYYESDLVVTGSDAGAGDVEYADALFFGCGAGVFAECQSQPDWVEKTFNYGNSWGMGSFMIFGFDKSQFTKGGAVKDYGVIRIRTAAKQPV